MLLTFLRRRVINKPPLWEYFLYTAALAHTHKKNRFPLELRQRLNLEFLLIFDIGVPYYQADSLIPHRTQGPLIPLLCCFDTCLVPKRDGFYPRLSQTYQRDVDNHPTAMGHWTSKRSAFF